MDADTTLNQEVTDAKERINKESLLDCRKQVLQELDLSVGKKFFKNPLPFLY